MNILRKLQLSSYNAVSHIGKTIFDMPKKTFLFLKALPSNIYHWLKTAPDYQKTFLFIPILLLVAYGWGAQTYTSGDTESANSVAEFVRFIASSFILMLVGLFNLFAFTMIYKFVKWSVISCINIIRYAYVLFIAFVKEFKNSINYIKGGK